MNSGSIATSTIVSLVVFANVVFAATPPSAQAFGVAPGMITIKYHHDLNDSALGITISADERGVIQNLTTADGQIYDGSLQPSTEHKYRVCAVYENDETACTDWLVARTLGPPSPPSNFAPPIISDVQATPTSVRISWGPIGTYSSIMVGWSEIGLGRSQPFVRAIPNSSYTVENLTPGRTFKFALKGCAQNVWNTSCGPWSPSVDVTTPMPAPPWSKLKVIVSEYSISKVVLQFSTNAIRPAGPELFIVYRDKTPIQQLKPEGAATPGPRMGTFTDLTETRHVYNVCIRDEKMTAQVCSLPAMRPLLPHERVVSKGPSPATGCVYSLPGCVPVAPPQPSVHPATCKNGFVWREAYPGDIVCVPPQTRAQAAADNSQAANRRVPNGPTCKNGFVWREARAGDVVCVTPEIRTQTGLDNRLANERRLVPIIKTLGKRTSASLH